MKSHAVMLGVKPWLRTECKFWLGDDGWNGSSEEPPITVQSSTFEQAKSDMEMALGSTSSRFCTQVGQPAKDMPPDPPTAWRPRQALPHDTRYDD